MKTLNQIFKKKNDNGAVPSENKDGQTMKVTVHNLMILDESGSMQSIYAAALGGANETIQTIRSAQAAHPEQDHRFTFVTFNTAGGHFGSPASIKTVFDDVPIGEVRDLTDGDYHPNACTPLYDAMGHAIGKLDRKAKDGDCVLVTVITDGLENASREFSGAMVKEMVARLRKKGWTFVYIGANQDAVEVARNLSIRNSLNFMADEAGTDEMFSITGKRMEIFYSKIDPCLVRSDEDFFGEDENSDTGEE